MAGSQLKRLKASLREQGLVGPQQSKKQKKKNAQDVALGKVEKRLKKSVALEGIREQFNPFQFTTNARGPKFDVTTNKSAHSKAGIKGRPGVSKSVGEERRRQTLLVEMQRKNKVGGILDRRFGEDDPTMAPEEKALQRFAMEKQRSHKKSSLFDLEENEAEVGLTHMGKSLSFEKSKGFRDDFDPNDLPSENESDLDNINPMRLKRMRGQGSSDDEEGEDADQMPERKKTKQEVYKEIIEKSKAHKYERQAAKDADEDLREKIDQDFSNMRSLLFSKAHQAPSADENSRPAAKLVAGVDKEEFEKAYDVRVRKMIQDKRAQPSERTKTEEEKAAEESARLKELEEKRLRRMRGEADSDDSDEEAEAGGESDGGEATVQGTLGALNGDEDDEDEFQLGGGVKKRPTATELGFDDEDDFIIDDDLVASGSDLDLDDEDDEDEEGGDDDESGASVQGDSESEDEFTKGLLTENEAKQPDFTNPHGADQSKGDGDGIPYTFPCPQAHTELQAVLNGLPPAKLTTVIQRIRALYHPKLDSRNKERMGSFSRVLVQHISHLGNASSGEIPSASVEGLIRHIHSLAKTWPLEIAREFRSCLQDIASERPLALNRGDLLILTAIGSVFPTSDHFHRVVTPAMLTMARFLGQNIPRTLADYSTGTYLSILSLQYQTLSKRYVPELVNFTLNTLCALAPVECQEKLGFFPLHKPSETARIRISNCQEEAIRKLDCFDCDPTDSRAASAPGSVKIAILNTAVKVLAAAADCWSGKPAFYETFEPAPRVLRHLCSKPNRPHLPAAATKEAERVAAHLEAMLRAARLSRRPLELHHHRPVAIRTYVPKFEESFAPGKHYDPDRERAELAKLRKEHKKERKGAMRELRKDAHFVARERLKAKIARDEAYERKFSRLVKDIQNEEGHEANLYDREKQLRKPRKKR